MIHRVRARLLVGLAVLALAMVAALPVQAAGLPFKVSGSLKAVDGPASFVGSGVTRFTAAQAPLAFTSVRYYVLSGQDQAGTTVYSFDLEATAGVPVAATELANDASTGRQLIAVGTPTAASLQALTSSASGASATDVAAGSGASADALATVQSTHGFFSTFWTDPIGITVNDVIDEAHWSYDGSHVSSLTGNDGRQWLSGNGWWEVSHSIGAYYNSAHTVGTVYTNDHFRTSSWFPFPFCGTTDVYYSANNVYGFADGHVGGGVNTWQTGACGFLLSYTAFASPGA